MEGEALSILIAEDDRLSRELLQSHLERSGHSILSAENGREALDMFRRHAPDLIILDVKMPVMDGLEACRYLKGMMREHWVPVLMISSNDEEQDQVSGLGVGADYYLTKPISFPILDATVESSQRIAGLQRQLESRNQELADYYRHSQRENELAQAMIERIVQQSSTPDAQIHQSVRAVEQFSGDVVSVVNTQSGDTYAMVADATGHGLPAAITLMPAMETFYRMSRRGYQVNTIACQINRTLRERLPPSHFLAATLVLISPQRRSLFAWNGGCPSGYILSPEGAIKHRIHSAHPPLGVLGDEEFDDTVQLCSVSESDHLFACTDGLTEARNETGAMFGAERLETVLMECLAKPGENPWCPAETNLVECTTQALTDFRGRAVAGDDQSMLALTVETPPEAIGETAATPGIRSAPEKTLSSLSGWDLQLELRGADILNTEIVPTVNQAMENLRLDETMRQRVFVVLTELLNNALDHGLLGLDSARKDSEGFEDYIREREKRLGELEGGFIRVMANRNRYRNRGPVLRLMVTDSGPGFDTAFRKGADTSGIGTTPFYGRGLKLVSSLADAVRFLDSGASVEVTFTLDPG